MVNGFLNVILGTWFIVKAEQIESVAPKTMEDASGVAKVLFGVITRKTKKANRVFVRK